MAFFFDRFWSAMLCLTWRWDLNQWNSHRLSGESFKIAMVGRENRDHKLRNIVLVAIVFLVVLELIIYLIAASSSGIEYRVLIEDREGHVLYETPGKHLTRYEELSFQNRYGPVENYIVRVVTAERPFPFRAWFIAATGVPIGGILILAFLIKGYMAIFDRSFGQSNVSTDYLEGQEVTLTPKQSLLKWFQSLSLFHIGVLILALLVAMWVVPNVISETITKIVVFMENHPVFSGATFALVAGIIIWIIYLRYKLAREAVRYQFELAKMRLERKALENSYPKLAGNIPPSITSGEESDERRNYNEMV